MSTNCPYRNLVPRLFPLQRAWERGCPYRVLSEIELAYLIDVLHSGMPAGMLDKNIEHAP